MSEGRPPSPDFDESRYERPNKNWLCGHTCDGCPCRIGQWRPWMTPSQFSRLRRGRMMVLSATINREMFRRFIMRTILRR